MSETPRSQDRPTTGAFEPVNYGDTYDETRLAPTARTKFDFAAWLGRTFGDIYIFDETQNAEVHAAVAHFVPNRWRTITVNGSTFRKGTNAIRVLLLWHTAITYALEVGVQLLGNRDIEYSVGFVFSDDVAADHRELDGGHVFSLKPVNFKGKMAYSVSQRASLKRLMSYAKHEVVHVVERYHDEDFSRLREEIDMCFDEAECLRRMKVALRSMPDLTADTDDLRRAA